MPPQAVIFDLGKVLLDFDYAIAARKLAAQSRLPAGELQRQIDQSHLLLEYEEGKLTSAEFHGRVRGVTGFTGTFAEFSAAFADIFAEIPPMVDLQRRLKAGGVPCFIFSNTNEIAIGHIRRNFPFFANFDGHIYSYEHRAMKPDPRLYEVVEQMTGLTGDALLYLDDRAENVAGGEARGWRTILHVSPGESIAAVAATGLVTN